MDGGHISLHHVLRTHHVGDVVADSEACRVRIREQDQTVFLRQRPEQLLALFVFINAKTIRQQDHGIGQVRQTDGIVLALHDQHPVGMDHLALHHLPLPASARRHRAVSSSVCAATGWLFRLWSSSSSTCKQASSWGRV